MSRLIMAREQIIFARKYTLRLLEDIDYVDWFRQPKEGITHIAWQVGHLAVAQYRLALERIRGRKPEDADLVSDHFLKIFGKESVPDPDPLRNPTPEEIRKVFNRLHERTLDEISKLSEDELDKPVLKAHRLAKTKYQSLLWCAHHEMLHAGQIGLLRRLFGEPPLW